MTTKEDITKFMNLFACALKIVHKYAVSGIEYTAISHYQLYESKIKGKLDKIWSKSDNNAIFFQKIGDLINRIDEVGQFEEKYVQAVELCKWLDNKLTYEESECSDGIRICFSLNALFHMKLNQAIEINSLNSNVDDTKIWINPKFETFPVFSKSVADERKVKFCNRDAFFEINGDLNSVSYYVVDEKIKIKIKNIIMDPSDLKDEDKESINIFFAPMSDEKDILDYENVTIKRYGMSCDGIKIKSLNNAGSLDERFRRDWELACENQADIFFAPEMLGTDKIYEQDDIDSYHKMICNYVSKDINRKVPGLTILPSRWKDFRNVINVIDHEGYIIGEYEKFIPFVDKSGHKIEALKQRDQTEILVFHIPGYHRISLLICAEFIFSDSPCLREFVCKYLQSTLIIVPSYSRGESDFINELPSVSKYGASVIWGDCCGAVKGTPKAIGGISLIGTKQVELFGGKCKCGFQCDKIKACGFIVKIPLCMEKKKLFSDDYNNVVQHIIIQE